MSQKYPNILIPNGTYSPEAENNLAKMDCLCADFATVEDNKAILDSLHSLYWQVVTNIIPTFITEETKEEFSIPHDYSLFLNYGVISEKTAPNYQTAITPTDEISEEDKHIYSEYRIITLAQWLQKLHNTNVKKSEKERLERRLKKAKEDLANYPKRLDETIQKRKEFFHEYPAGIEVLNISHEIESRLPKYNEIKEKIELSQRITTEERTVYVKLTEELSSLRDVRAKEQQAVSDKVPQNEMMRYDREVESVLLLKGILEKEVVNAQVALEEDVAWRKNVTIAACREMMKEELRRTRTLIELAARRSHVKPLSIFIDKDPIPQAKTIVDAIEAILEVDPSLLAKGTRARDRFPTILIVPIFGDGIYDFENNMILIPTRSPKGLTQSVATALIEYHLETESGNKFKQSYLELRKSEGIVSSIKLRERMLRDYIGWVTLEANGYQVMDQKTKQWFIENVAPTMFSLKHPRRLGDFPVADGHKIIAAYEERKQSDQRDYTNELKVGIAYWRTGQYDKANQAFINAFNLDSQSQDACYNAALSSFKIGQKQKAIEYWRAYLRLDKMSFWTVRVQKFLNTVR